MSTIVHFVVSALLSILVTGAVFIAVNLVLFISSRGNPRWIKTMYSIRDLLRTMPPGTVFECEGRRISAVVYDRQHDKDSVIGLAIAPLASPLTWKSGPRSSAMLYGKANAELAISIGALAFVYIPLLVVGIGLAISTSWLWWLAVISLIGVGVVVLLTNKFFFLKWSAFSTLIPVVLLHRYHLYSITVLYIVSFVLLVISMAVTVWAERAA